MVERKVIKYVNARVRMTRCMQENFRQLCTKCRKYDNCKVYSRYVDAWMELQSIVGIGESP